MAKQKTGGPTVSAIPVAEGVRFEYGDASACAVRNRQKDITVQVRQHEHIARRIIDHVPLMRGIYRLFAAILSLFSGLFQSQELEPREAIRGNARTRRIASLFRTRPQTLTALGSGIAMIAIVLLMMLGLPALVGGILGLISGLPRFATNTVCCMFRLLGAFLSVYMICRLRVFNRLCMYRGAAGKVINAYETFGAELTHEEVVLSSRLTDRSDGSFVLIVTAVSIAAYACVPASSLGTQIVRRIGILLIAAAVVNELIRPLENAGPSGTLAEMRRPLTELQHLFTIEPHNQMIEVALCAFRAAYENASIEEDEEED